MDTCAAECCNKTFAQPSRSGGVRRLYCSSGCRKRTSAAAARERAREPQVEARVEDLPVPDWQRPMRGPPTLDASPDPASLRPPSLPWERNGA
jgi:hypothetical protein